MLKYSQGKILNGRTLFITEHDILAGGKMNQSHSVQYCMIIWKDFKGITYRKIVNDKKVYTKVVRQSFSGIDYATAFVLLRSHFNIQ